MAMRHTDHRTLIDRGRKAGLRTAELYNAMAAHPFDGRDHALKQADGNGFVPAFDGHGQCIYRPGDSSNRG
jgi:hypothetical protein